MSHSPIVAPPELARPDYIIYDYRNGIYKIVRFRSTAPHIVPASARCKKGNETKLDPAISRARRMVLEYALCNPWDWFCTFTLDGGKFDRFDLAGWHSSFQDWVRYQRKKGYDINYILVPERHKDGAWHAHGLFRGDVPLTSFRDIAASGVKVPKKLVEGGFYNWADYQNKFGFCSFGRVRNRVAVGFYISKYIEKSIGKDVLNSGVHLYWATRPLERANFHGDIYGNCSYLDGFLTNEYEFCDTGMTHVKDGLDWSFALEYMILEPLEADSSLDQMKDGEVDAYMEAVQMAFDDF